MSETISTAHELLKEYMRADIPCWLLGPPGVGKSSLARQLADEEGIGFIDLRLSQMDPVDLRGLPKHSVADKVEVTTWSRPDFWPDVKRDGPKGIILFDEMSDAGRAMQSAAYQIILDRKAGPHEIPRGWYPMAAGNRREDKAAAMQISTALATRFAWINVSADVDSFREWGMRPDVNIHHYVLGYLKAFPTHIWTTEGANSNTFACPRQWEQVSKLLHNLDADGGGKAAVAKRYRLVQGLLGQGVAGQFEAAIKAFNLPDLDEVVADPKRCRIPSQPAEKYALASMLAQNATTKNFGKLMTYAKRADFGRDFWICMTLDATHRDASLCDTPAFTEFANENAHMKL